VRAEPRARLAAYFARLLTAVAIEPPFWEVGAVTVARREQDRTHRASPDGNVLLTKRRKHERRSGDAPPTLRDRRKRR
jgi:hypothetical protein